MGIENGRWTYAEVVCIATTINDLVQTLCCSKTCWTGADDEDVDFSGYGVSEFVPGVWNDGLHVGGNDEVKAQDGLDEDSGRLYSRMRRHHHLDKQFTCNGRNRSHYLGCSFCL